MSVGSGTSFILSSILSILLFSGMQMYRHSLAASPMFTIFGGFLASLLFMLVLTDVALGTINRIIIDFLSEQLHVQFAIGNIETAIFGKNFQTKLFPEVVFCLTVAVLSAGMVHRVCTTTCVLFSLIALYYMNKLSQQIYSVPTAAPIPQGKRKK